MFLKFALTGLLLIGLPLSSTLPAADRTEISSENLYEPPLFTQSQLLEISNLNQRVAAATNASQRELLSHQRSQALAQLIRTIFSQKGKTLVPLTSDAELQQLRDAVTKARRGADETAEMTAILRLNGAVLDQSFDELLTTVAHAWIMFSPASAFNDAFDTFERRTRFNQAPFTRAVERMRTKDPADTSTAGHALITAYDTYDQRVEVYDSVKQSLRDFVMDAVRGNRLLRWFGISSLIGTIDSQPWAVDFNDTVLPGRIYSLGQFVAAVVVFLMFSGVGLSLLPVLRRTLRRHLPASVGNRIKQVAKGAVDGTNNDATERFMHLLQLSLERPLRALLLLFATAMATRVLFLRESDESMLEIIDVLYIVLIVWALLRLIDTFVILYSKEMLRRYPTLRGELVNFMSSVVRFTVVVIAVLYLMQRLGYDVSTLLASLGIGGLAIAFAAKETISNIFGCVSIIADDMFHQGDWIVTPNGEGTVIDIGLRSTKIRTFDNAVIFLPNGYLAGVDVLNWDRRKMGRRIKFTLGLEYGSDMGLVHKTIDDIRAMLSAHDGVADSSTDTSAYVEQQASKISDAMDSCGIKRTLLVYLNDLGESSIDILVYCFSKSVDWEEWLKVKQDVIFRCCAIVKANGLNTAFPTQTLYLREDGGSGATKQAVIAAGKNPEEH